MHGGSLPYVLTHRVMHGGSLPYVLTYSRALHIGVLPDGRLMCCHARRLIALRADSLCHARRLTALRADSFKGLTRRRNA